MHTCPKDLEYFATPRRIQGCTLKEQNTLNPLDTCACCALGGFLGDLWTSLNRCRAPHRFSDVQRSPRNPPSAQHAHVSKGFGVFCSFKAPPWIPGRRGLATGRRQEHLVAVLSTSRRRPWAAAPPVSCPDHLFFHYICAARPPRPPLSLDRRAAAVPNGRSPPPP